MTTTRMLKWRSDYDGHWQATSAWHDEGRPFDVQITELGYDDGRPNRFLVTGSDHVPSGGREFDSLLEAKAYAQSLEPKDTETGD